MLWLLLQAIVFFKTGVLASVDSDLYIGNASEILKGNLPQGREFFYLSYSFLLACLMHAGADVFWIALGQSFAGLTSVYAVYRLAERYGRMPLAGFLSALLYALWFKFQQWNLIIYTDALFAAMSVNGFYLLANSKRIYEKFFSLVVLAFTAFLRPTGIGLIIAMAAFLLHPYLKRSHIGWHVAFGVAALVTLNGVLKEFVTSVLNSYAKAEVIYPDMPFLLTPPANITIPSENYPPLVRLVLFWAYQPLYMLQLSTVKLLLFLAHAKPYYSVAHNLLIACFLYPCYAAAYVGFRRLAHPAERLFIGLFIGFQVLTVSQTTENWDGRFLLPVLPWVFLLAGIAFASLTQNFIGLRKAADFLYL